jgi:hypothetical protein
MLVGMRAAPLDGMFTHNGRSYRGMGARADQRHHTTRSSRW